MHAQHFLGLKLQVLHVSYKCDSVTHASIVVLYNYRPLINHKVEDKVCGEGPDLEAIFEADSHLQGLCQSIQVGVVHKTYM